ncbi:hypothetical protein [Accumulibacter sp.]|uniref:hypothetical protein n=1 Tax=Accumulibacter sp. TaxID=2053492 RepID=UPI0026246370|nr:hypothetical protein [Accumulibacter sp.]
MEQARVAAKHFGCRHCACTVTPDILVADIPAVAQHHDQPFGNSRHATQRVFQLDQALPGCTLRLIEPPCPDASLLRRIAGIRDPADGASAAAPCRRDARRFRRRTPPGCSPSAARH